MFIKKSYTKKIAIFALAGLMIAGIAGTVLPAVAPQQDSVTVVEAAKKVKYRKLKKIKHLRLTAYHPMSAPMGGDLNAYGEPLKKTVGKSVAVSANLMSDYGIELGDYVCYGGKYYVINDISNLDNHIDFLKKNAKQVQKFGIKEDKTITFYRKK